MLQVKAELLARRGMTTDLVRIGVSGAIPKLAGRLEKPEAPVLPAVDQTVTVVDGSVSRTGLLHSSQRMDGTGGLSHVCQPNSASAEDWCTDWFMPMPKPSPESGHAQS